MCGLSGLWRSRSDVSPERLADIVRGMTDTLAHRGPDGNDVWVDPRTGCALGHRRLAILDLSAAGHQPMTSVSGRFTLVFNGEIYNHLALREALARAGNAPAWRGHSDTETLLAAFEAWGVIATLQALTGMFAMALWDHDEQTLSLVRDRFGEKPLYYGWTHDGTLVFASELKALRAYPGFDPGVCREALALYLRFNHVPAPRTIHPGLFKLEPGCLLTVSGRVPVCPDSPPRPGQRHGSLGIMRWWSLAEAAETSAARAFQDDAHALGQLSAALTCAVRDQLMADVPVGAFLSGGVDSSLIVAIMQQQSTRPVKTFTIGFEEEDFDESVHARAVASHLGTEHHELRVSSAMARDLLDALPSMYDEPFADSSQLPTHWVCRAARGEVTVALTGDAGDELFAGYNRHLWAPRIWSKVGHWPPSMRQALSQLLGILPMHALNALSGPLGMVHAGDKLQKLSQALASTRTLDDLYLNLLSAWSSPTMLLQDHGDGSRVLEPDFDPGPDCPTLIASDAVAKIMYLDAVSYLPDDILCKVDRAAMAVSLETRVPFLDHRVADLAWRLPARMRIRDGKSKWALRQLLDRHVPRELIERPKAGFAMPLGQWLRGPWRDWAESLLDSARLAREGYLRPAPIRAAWDEHLRGRADHSARLWSVLMFQAWLESRRG